MDRQALIEVAAHAILSAWAINGSSIEAVKVVCQENGVECDDGIFKESAELAGRKWREATKAARA